MPPVTFLWFDAALLPEGWCRDVRLSIGNDGIISAVEKGVSAESGDEIGGVALPGVSNLHSHAFQRGMAGLAEVRGPTADTFWTWREVMYHFLGCLSPEDVEAVAAQAYIEMLEGGFTRVGEFHYLHNDCDGTPYANPAELSDRICAAAMNTGINLTLLPVFYAHSDFGGHPPTPGQRRFVTSLDRFADLFESAGRSARALPGATVGVAPHSLRAVTPEELTAVVALCPDGPIHIHTAEQVKEVDDCVAATGARPVQWLLDHTGIGSAWCVIHATHLDATEVARLATSGATVGLCPITEANLGDGVFGATEFLAAGGRFGVGTDSNVDIGVAGELRMLEYAQRLTHRARNVMAKGTGASTGRSLYDMAVVGGNAALGSGSVGLSVRARADIVSLATPFTDLSVRECGDTLMDRFIFTGRAAPGIDTVWVNGHRVVSNGRHRRRDEISQAFRATLRRVLAN